MPKKSIAPSPSIQPRVKPVATLPPKKKRPIRTEAVPVRKPVAFRLDPVVTKKREAAGKRLLVFGTATVKKGVSGFVHLASLVRGLFYPHADRA